ncbi:hypothetical protein TNCV_4181191 [Trichonephila clavipes]|nr:hypothetical protein TNCV_4181191 [Trichonephila clavipes]
MCDTMGLRERNTLSHICDHGHEWVKDSKSSIRYSGAGVHEQLFQSSDQFDAKPPVFSSEVNFVPIYRATEGRKCRVDLAQTGIRSQDLR